MKVTHLSLTNFRNYAGLEIDLPPEVSIFLGDNAQGKSNFLEALQLLAAGKSPRASNEGELIAWSALSEPLPVCRLAADVRKAGAILCLELALRARAPTGGAEGHDEPVKAPLVQKRVRINGVVRRASDLAGQLNVVSFSADDINIIGGEPTLRRRFLDLVNCQLDPHYYRHLHRYQRVLWQRNRLLQLLAAKQASFDELTYWDNELVLAGSYLLAGRRRLLSSFDEPAADILEELSGNEGKLGLVYVSSIGAETGAADPEEIKQSFSAKLGAVRDREVAQGVSLAGPHRDDLRMLCGGIDQGVYGSRGQQRTIALALKLAQARILSSKTGEHPVLFLDDVLSELDQHRRACLLEAVNRYEQVLITATDRTGFEPAFLQKAALYSVERGSISPLSR